MAVIAEPLETDAVAARLAADLAAIGCSDDDDEVDLSAGYSGWSVPEVVPLASVDDLISGYQGEAAAHEVQVEQALEVLGDSGRWSIHDPCEALRPENLSEDCGGGQNALQP